MAFSTSRSGLSRSRYRGGTSTLSEINVVPLVDVVLVLLIIFMLTAHVMEFGMEVDVPKTRMSKDTAEEFPVVTINKDNETFVNDKAVNINLLGQQIVQSFGRTKEVYLRVDKSVTWDTMSQVVAALGEAKLGVKLVTMPVDEGARPR